MSHKISLKKIHSKSTKNINNKIQYIHPNQIIKKRMEKEGRFNQTIFEMIENPNHLHLDYVSVYKPKFRQIKGIHDQDKIALVEEINFLRKAFYNFEQNKYTKKKYKPFQNEDDNNFIEKYKVFKTKVDDKYFGIKKLLYDLHKTIEKKDMKIPPIDPNKNLFKKNLLLIKSENIRKFMNFNMGSKKSDGRAYNYLNNFNTILNDKLNGNNEEFSNPEYSQENPENELAKTYFLEDENNNKKITSLKLSESMNNINNINKILQNLDEVDEFNLLDNKEYFNLLKKKRNDNFIRNRRINKTFFVLPKTSMNKIFHANEENKISYNLRKQKINKSLTIKNDDKNIYKTIKIKRNIINNNLDKINPQNRSIFSRTNEFSSFEKKDLIKLKKIYLNNKNRRYTLKSVDSKTSTMYPNTSKSQFFVLQNKSMIEPKGINQSSDNKETKNGLKEVYETIKNSDDQIKNNKVIENYLKNKNMKERPDLSLDNLFSDYYKIKVQIFQEDCLKKNMRLKKESKIDLESIVKLKHYFNITNLQMKNIRDKMDNIINKVSNPIKNI